METKASLKILAANGTLQSEFCILRSMDIKEHIDGVDSRIRPKTTGHNEGVNQVSLNRVENMALPPFLYVSIEENFLKPEDAAA